MLQIAGPFLLIPFLTLAASCTQAANPWGFRQGLRLLFSQLQYVKSGSFLDKYIFSLSYPGCFCTEDKAEQLDTEMKLTL